MRPSSSRRATEGRHHRLRCHRGDRRGLRAVGIPQHEQLTPPRPLGSAGWCTTWAGSSHGGPGFVLFVIWLAASKSGASRSAGTTRSPSQTVSWIAMMFSAGMGIGLMFYGVPSRCRTSSPRRPALARPATRRPRRTRWPPPCSTGRCTRGRSTRSSASPSRTACSARVARCSSARRSPPCSERSGGGPAGRVIDMLAIFATLFGSAASLGLGALQIGSGSRDRRRPGQDRKHGARRHHRRPHGLLHPVGRVRCRQGHPVAVQHQHGAGPRASPCSCSWSAPRSSSSTSSQPRSAPTSRTSR